jgi:RNA polymerase sigma factor (sigma-70 family)
VRFDCMAHPGPVGVRPVLSSPFCCVAILADNPARSRILSQAFVDRGLTVRAFDSVDALLADTSLEGVGCIVADDMVPGAAEDLFQKMQGREKVPPLILLTDQPDLAATARAMRAGLYDIVERSDDDAELFQRTSAALQQDSERRQLHQKADSARHLLAQLSPREKEVLDLVVKAKSNKEISSDLHLSPRTVENHRARILRKLQAESAMQLLRITLEAKGIPLP